MPSLACGTEPAPEPCLPRQSVTIVIDCNCLLRVTGHARHLRQQKKCNSLHQLNTVALMSTMPYSVNTNLLTKFSNARILACHISELFQLQCYLLSRFCNATWTYTCIGHVSFAATLMWHCWSESCNVVGGYQGTPMLQPATSCCCLLCHQLECQHCNPLAALEY